ncbi:MAG: laccase domain-containing protein [Candidatus Nomurabacteria bacterium]|jgi:copper oxidase (laccase) domain-containing protein|nr:laccase domain-containing protein [Candidatus Nomurabacteria bacterium]
MRNDPIIFADGKVVIGLSTVTDGDMRLAEKTGDALLAVRANIANFLHRTGFSLEGTALVLMRYDKDDFTQYQVIDGAWAGKGMTLAEAVPAADGLATTARDLGLFLPLADCLGVVLYDPEHQALMVSHLGRHNLLQNGATRSVEFMTKQFSSKPERLQIWLSPAGGKENFPIWARDNKGLRELALEQFAAASVNSKNITSDETDTTISHDYFSHSQSLKTGEGLNKRFAIVARLT